MFGFFVERLVSQYEQYFGVFMKMMRQFEAKNVLRNNQLETTV
jgi:hypothetical protein